MALEALVLQLVHLPRYHFMVAADLALVASVHHLDDLGAGISESA